MEPEGSLSNSQEPTICTYPKAGESSPCHFLNINFTIILPSIPRSFKWSLSSRVPHQNPVCISPLLHRWYMPHPSHSSWFDHLNTIWWGVQIIKLLLMYSSPLTCYISSLLGINMLRLRIYGAIPPHYHIPSRQIQRKLSMFHEQLFYSKWYTYFEVTTVCTSLLLSLWHSRTFRMSSSI